MKPVVIEGERSLYPHTQIHGSGRGLRSVFVASAESLPALASRAALGRESSAENPPSAENPRRIHGNTALLKRLRDTAHNEPGDRGERAGEGKNVPLSFPLPPR